jgi:hypothetical protein
MSRSFGITNAAPYAAAPPVGRAGDVYFNTTDKGLYESDGVTWLRVGPTPTIGGFLYASIGTTLATGGAWNGINLTNTGADQSGLTNLGGAAGVRCDVAGRYHFEVIANSAQAHVGLSIRFLLTRGGVGQPPRDVQAAGGVSGHYVQYVADYLVQLGVGDVVQLFGNADVASLTLSASSALTVTAVGGPKGDPGGPIPPGGLLGQIIVKNSGADGDVRWADNAATSDWLPYTPVWVGQGANPAYGNSTIIGLYLVTGNYCELFIYLAMGSTINGGVGNLLFSLPVNASPIFPEHLLTSKTYINALAVGYLGLALIQTPFTHVFPSFPADRNSSYLQPWRGTSDGNPGNGVPAVIGDYTVAPGNNILVQGRYRVS